MRWGWDVQGGTRGGRWGGTGVGRRFGASGAHLLVQHDEEEVEARHDGRGDLEVVLERLGAVVAPVDGVGRGEDGGLCGGGLGGEGGGEGGGGGAGSWKNEPLLSKPTPIKSSRPPPVRNN